MSCNPKTGIDALMLCPISQAQARQRASCAGRSGPGKCYRLYIEHAYKHELPETSIGDDSS
jgi:ATP-dependent RNA helicase DHX8/PRP22